MGMSHATCTHPRTPAGRAACRKAGGPNAPTPVSLMAAPTMTDTRSRLVMVQALALRLMGEYGLTDWRFCWDNSVSRLGQCRYTRREIGLSRKFAEGNPIEEVEDTIRHEIAHALTPGAKHGPVWQRMAIRLGAIPSARKPVKLVAHTWTWVATCNTCGKEHGLSRQPRGARACTACCKKYNRGRFDMRYVLNWKRS